MNALTRHLGIRLDGWAKRRHGIQTSPVNLQRNRIYILPTRAGLVFVAMLFVMLIGSMNYNNSMGLALSFALGSFMFVAMHHCHRNLLGLDVHYNSAEPVFAGNDARIPLSLSNSHTYRRMDLKVRLDQQTLPPINLAGQATETLRINVATTVRGEHAMPRVRISCRYPCGLFEAWTWIYWDAHIMVYPKPGGRSELPDTGGGHRGGTRSRTHGEDELAELRDFQEGDNLSRIAWKTLARSDDLQTKTFEGNTLDEIWIDWQQVTDPDVETCLSQLTRWVVVASGQDQRFGLRLPTLTIAPNQGAAHRERCLTALALHT